MKQYLSPCHSSSLQQPSLFKSTLSEIEAQLGISADEMTCWHAKNWLSFKPCDLMEFDDKERDELAFIAALARSGLSDAMVTHLLARLPKPYCYHPATTFYSFVDHRWVSLRSEDEPSAVTDEYLDTLIENQDWTALRDLRDRISEALPADENTDTH
jgi:hypothetical protein